jgi:cation transport ATPase
LAPCGGSSRCGRSAQHPGCARGTQGGWRPHRDADRYNRTTAEAVARRLGIEEVEADILPEQKNPVVKRLRQQGRVVAMAGDGVSDAPALAAADVGIAMGTGTDVAIQSAGVTLVKDDLA